MNRSQAIRDYFLAHPTASPKEVVAGLAADGVEVTPNLVSLIKHQESKKTGTLLKRGTPGRKPAAAMARSSGSLSAQDLLETKRLVEQLGGLAEAKLALQMLEQLQ